MFEEYYNLYEKCEKIDNPSYKDLVEIRKEWDNLTSKLFENFDIEDITTMCTCLDDNLCNSNEYWDNFRSSLDYYSDRMNLNRWCRLQLLLGNAMDKLYEIGENYE